MYSETEGIVLRQTKTASGRRMITLFTRRFGKISAGTSINEGGKTRAALALRPFSLGKYDLYKSRENYSINNAEAVRSFFPIGEDVDRFMAASYVLELTDRLLEEEQPSSALYSLLEKTLSALEERTKAFGTLTAAFQLRLLDISGCAPQFSQCTRCGRKAEAGMLSPHDGGLVCFDCQNEKDKSDPSVFSADDTLTKALAYLQNCSVDELKNLALNPDIDRKASIFLKSYISINLGVDNLRSEGLKI